MDNKYLLGNYKCTNPDRGGNMTWGNVVDIKEDRAIVYKSTNPIGYKVFEVAIYELCNWIHDKVIWK